MTNKTWLTNINTEKLLKHYRRYRIARFLLLNPFFKMLALIIGGLVLIIIWPFALMYMVYRTIRFTLGLRKRHQRYTKNRNIIDL